MVNSCAHTTHDGNPSKRNLKAIRFLSVCTCVCADYYEMTRRKMSGGGGKIGEKKEQNSLAEK